MLSHRQLKISFRSSLHSSCRSLNELRALLMEANRHSPGPERDLSREVHKAEWRLKEQKLKDDIKGLREKLSILVRTGRVENLEVVSPGDRHHMRSFSKAILP